jgi:hypothetical protein
MGSMLPACWVMPNLSFVRAGHSGFFVGFFSSQFFSHDMNHLKIYASDFFQDREFTLLISILKLTYF